MNWFATLTLQGLPKRFIDVTGEYDPYIEAEKQEKWATKQ